MILCAADVVTYERSFDAIDEFMKIASVSFVVATRAAMVVALFLYQKHWRSEFKLGFKRKGKRK